MKIVNGWLDEAIEIDYQQKSMSRLGYKPKYICLHGTAGGSSAENIANYFATSTVQASTHLIIGQDGHIVQGVSMNQAAWGNGVLTAGHASYLPDNVNPNLTSISIEHVKPSNDNSDVLTSIQVQKSFQVVQCICDTYGIPKRAGDGNGGVISHADIDPVNRARCPGPYPWDALWAYLKGGTTCMVPQGWKDDGKVLSFGGIPVDAGFRTYILSHPWDAANVPLGPAYGASPVQLHRPDLGAGTRQLFKFGLLWWTPKVGVVYEQQWGLELNAAYAAIPKKA
jgi:hypothetical protein